MKNLFKIAVFVFLALGMLSANAQVYNYEDGEGPPPADSIKGLYVGLNLGFYLANKKTAIMYAGYGYNRDGTLINNFRETWLNNAIQEGNINPKRTNEAMENRSWKFDETDMPGEMTYRPSFMFGGHIRYMINSDFGFFLEGNGTFPVTVGQFTIQMTETTAHPGERYWTFSIRGEEQRFMINLGLHRVMGRKAAEYEGREPTILPYFDMGGTVLFTKFEENLIDLGEHVINYNRIVDLTQFYNQQGQYLYGANVLTGVGFGGFAALGIQVTLGRKFTIDMGYVANLQQVKLGQLSELGFQHQFLIRAIYM